MTTGDTAATYRHVSDGQLPKDVGLVKKRLLLLSGLWVPVAVLLSVGAAFLAYGDSARAYPGRTLEIGLLWSLPFLAPPVIVLLVCVPPSIRQQRKLARWYGAGAVTEVEVSPDGLVVTRPESRRVLPYDEIIRVRQSSPFLMIFTRGLKPELLPMGLLPDSAVAHIRARSEMAFHTRRLRGPKPRTDTPLTDPTRVWVVPAGWAARAARLNLGLVVRARRWWVNLAIAAAVASALAAAASPLWLVGFPAWVVLNLAVLYVSAKRTFETALPVGSVASTNEFTDHFLYSNALGVREFHYQDFASLVLAGDIAGLTATTHRGLLIFPRELVPEELEERLRN